MDGHRRNWGRQDGNWRVDGYRRDDMDGQWTVVRYGKRKRRGGDRDGSGGPGWRSASALPPSNRGRPQVSHETSFSNRPAPPSGGARRGDPKPRTYAAVVRDDNEQQDRVNPEFGRLVRKMYPIIKTVHHLRNVSGTTEPKMISRMVKVLSTMIQPAFPTEDTVDLIKGNALNWGYTSMLILENHYNAGLEKALEDISQIMVPEWRPAFEVAVKWARRNLPRVTQETIEHAEACIAEREPDRAPPQQVRVVEEQPQVPQRTSAVQQQPQASQQASVVEQEPQAPQQTPVVEQQLHTRTTQTQQQISVVEQEPQTTQTERISSHTQTDKNPPDVQNMPRGSLTTSQVTEPLILFQEPKEQRPLRPPRTPRGCVVSEDSPLLDIGMPEIPAKVMVPGADHLLDSAIPQDFSWLLQGTPNSVSTEDRGALGKDGRQEVVAQVHGRVRFQEIGEETNLEVDEEEYEDEEVSVQGDEPTWNVSSGKTSTPNRVEQRVTQHIHTERKMIDWDLWVEKKWVILGDSNLSRFPGFSNPDLQIESYPGANFRHAQALIMKAKCRIRPEKVQKVVLAFGINSRGQKPKETTVKQLQAALREAKKKFPRAELWVPMVNFSSQLPHTEQINLRTLNEHIDRNMPRIPALPSRHFMTGKDKVHWTRDTARAMLTHWTKFLNLCPQ